MTNTFLPEAVARRILSGAKLKLRRLQNAEWQRRLREDRDRRRACRTCGDPVGISERTGKPTRQCPKHLAGDVARKAIYILPFQCPEAKARGKFDLEYPLIECGLPS